MMSAKGIQEPSNKRQFDTLLIDANLALASLDSETPESESSRQQKLEKAHRAYQSITAFARHTPHAVQAATLPT